MAKKPGVVATLTHEEILLKALELADIDGIETVSVRRLAHALGKSPMALYTYFGSIQEVYAGVVAMLFREVDADPVLGERWDDTLRRTMNSIRQLYLRHPHADLLKVEQSGYSQALAEHTARIYALHEAQGIPDDVLRRIWCMVDAFLGGFIGAELAELREQSERPDPQGRIWMQTAENAYTEESFADGIEIIIAGIRALNAPDPCEWHTPSGCRV